MGLQHRSFVPPDDFAKVSDLLTRLYEPSLACANWLQPIWEYAWTHPWFDHQAVDRIGLWEDEGRLVGQVTYELRLGEAFLNLDPAYAALQPAMLEHAEANLRAAEPDGTSRLTVFVNDFDAALAARVRAGGYRREAAADRAMAWLAIPSSCPPVRLPVGFRLVTMAEDNDLRKLDRVLHRGFNHPGEPPEDGLGGRRRMQSGPHCRRELAIAVVAPSGEWVSFCGLWLDPAQRFGYVEPVATDPDYRRRGLASAAVREGLRRCGELGATVAYVGSLKPLYQSLGFRAVGVQQAWSRHWPSD